LRFHPPGFNGDCVALKSAFALKSHANTEV
jgi:hypothetical protein